MNTYWHDFIGGWVGGKLFVVLNIGFGEVDFNYNLRSNFYN